MTRGLISIVDDDESIRRTTTFLIESFGFRAAAFNMPKIPEVRPTARYIMSHR